MVGGGNTGFQLAQELAATHDVHLAVGTRQTPLPQHLLGRDVFDVLHYSGVMRVTAGSPLGRRLRHRDVLIGCGPRSARRAGVTAAPPRRRRRSSTPSASPTPPRSPSTPSSGPRLHPRPLLDRRGRRPPLHRAPVATDPRIGAAGLGAARRRPRRQRGAARTCIRSPCAPCTLRISTDSSPDGPNQCGTLVCCSPLREQPIDEPDARRADELVERQGEVGNLFPAQGFEPHPRGARNVRGPGCVHSPAPSQLTVSWSTA